MCKTMVPFVDHFCIAFCIEYAVIATAKCGTDVVLTIRKRGFYKCNSVYYRKSFRRKII